ncbi:hypothetical protein J2787_003825 [Chryseobacterium rhizosphaerae]|uniref:Uncharacterized protein n=1 Tax=Chryseobacterium rhizosphaerae TaxID=395937 RepID=A0AAE3YA75_9FLAO|nr:hypothetical protein [Chryseobacterium rhizosphaerae]MDR6528388.1 hypothetical protein [Chryseobacterium rhizosphaerae]
MTRNTEKLILNWINEMTSDSLKNREIFEQAEKIIVWIVGFSIGVFALQVPEVTSNYKSIEGVRKIIMTYSLYTIIFGISFRISSFLTEIILKDILTSFKSKYFGEKIMLEIKKQHISSETHNANQIIDILNEEFNFNIEKASHQLNENKDFIDTLINIYENSFNDMELLDTITKDSLIYFGYKKNGLVKITNSENFIYFRGILYRLLTAITSLLFITTLGFFLFGAIKIFKFF